MKIIGLIPARMASTRFPNKPMVDVKGIPMIGHCYIRSKLWSLLDDVYVATCDEVICDYMNSIGGKSVMTANTHERASDRCAEALLKIEAQTGEYFDIVVMIQGDEPLILPEMIEQVAQELVNDTENGYVSNTMQELFNIEDQESPNTVKVATDLKGNALYFSREPIPSRKKTKDTVRRFKQLGLIAFTRKALLEFINLEPTPLEIIESVDMNRVLEHGRRIQMLVTTHDTDAIDVPEDAPRLNEKMEKDALYPTYAAQFAKNKLVHPSV